MKIQAGSRVRLRAHLVDLRYRHFSPDKAATPEVVQKVESGEAMVWGFWYGLNELELVPNSGCPCGICQGTID